jgi:hypothetical protein
MVGLKRLIRHGVVISALGHVGVLAIGLLFVRASSQEAVPPEAMLVEIVTPKEIPRLSGTPSASPTSGTEQAAKAPSVTATNEQPPTAPLPPQQKEQRKAQRNPPPKAQEPQGAPPQTQAPPLTQADAAPIAKPQPQPPPDPSAPAAAATSQAPEIAATMAQLAQLALVGGRLGGGFAAPPIDSSLVGYDFTVQFRERVSWCSPLPPGISANEKISVPVRVFLKRDGTLAAAPKLLEANPSAKQQSLMESFAAGLQKCQPYTMLPQDKYSQWKVMDLFVFPMNSFGG